MIKNYIKMALKVLGRRKFFTFISLFGISFTLMVLTIISSFLDSEVGKNSPISNRDKLVFVPQLSMILTVKDTVWTLDSSLVDGIMYYDSTSVINDNDQSVSSSSLGYNYLDKYMRDIPGVANYSFYAPGHTNDLYRDGQKLTLRSLYTDYAFWEIFDFKIISGRTYSSDEITNQAPVALLSRTAAKSYFGSDDEHHAVGKKVILDNKQYDVIGVIEDVARSKYFLSSDLYLPYTQMREDVLTDTDFLGPFEVAYLASSPSEVNALKSEIKYKGESIDPPNLDQFNRLEINPVNMLEGYAQQLFYDEDAKKSLKLVFSVVLGFLLLFILLPTLNLININVTRILERSSEIGVRKAFGASKKHLFYQFIFENLILTLIGGAIGFMLALVTIKLLNSSNVLEETILVFNWKVFGFSLLICLAFGFLSGFIPAMRMSKMHIVNALNQKR